jgi:23S rRNA (guanosine2251-2'-O)-methyltransferase
MSWTTGIHAVETALEEKTDEVAELWLVQSSNPGPARRRLKRKAEDLQLDIRMVSDDQMRRAVGDVHHQGVAARVDEFEYADEAAVYAEQGKSSLIIALDGVQDPHNLGAVLRSACALGADAVVIPKHRAAPVTPAARKVSTGASERIPVAMVTNMAKFLGRAKEEGYWIYGTVVEGGELLGSVEFADRTVLVFGSEANGVRRGVKSRSDMEVTLSLEEMESLNVSVAAGIFMYEWRSQHGPGSQE